MDITNFRQQGKDMVDYIADYIEHIQTRKVVPDVKPGFLMESLPDHAPVGGESYEDIMQDVESKIMPGILHHQHPLFNAYFPAGHSFPSILGNILADGIACVSTSWATSPALTELEMVTTDWLGKMIGLPDEFLHQHGAGGGAIQGSGSECIFLALLAARHRTMKRMKAEYPDEEEGTILSKLVAYTSNLANVCVEKACLLGFVKLRLIEVDDDFSLRVDDLQCAIESDRKRGLYPFFVCGTIGTTSVCSFDNISEISKISKQENMWFHVDAAYAGAALVCPEFQYLIEGIKNVSSFSCNPHKWLLTGTEASVMWVRDTNSLTSSMKVDSLYLKHKNQDDAVDYRVTFAFVENDSIIHQTQGPLAIRFCLYYKGNKWGFPTRWISFSDIHFIFYYKHKHWSIDLSRPFRAMKLWFVLRMYGISGIQDYIRRHVKLAKRMEEHIKSEPGLEVVGKVAMGMICFRVTGSNKHTQQLLRRIHDSGKLHLTPAQVKDLLVIRYVVCAERTRESDVDFAWNIISSAMNELLAARG